VVVGDTDVVSVGDPDGVPESLALLDATLELSDIVLDVGVGVALPEPSDGETLLLTTVDNVVREGPVVGPIIPPLPLTVIEEKLIVRDWRISGGV
jgi:hypothetical protein